MLTACCTQLSLYHRNPDVFQHSQWQTLPTRSILYILYRYTFFLLFLLLLVFSVRAEQEPVKWIIYLTHWAHVFCLVQALLGFLLSCGYVTPGKIYKWYWFTHSIAVTFSLQVAVLYWTLEYKADVTKLRPLTFLLHGFNGVLMVLDLVLVAHPVKLAHGCLTVCINFCYMVFSIIYFYSGGTAHNLTYIYPALNWEKPLPSTIASLSAFILALILHSLCWAIYKFRVFIQRWYFVRQDDAMYKLAEQLNTSAIT